MDWEFGSATNGNIALMGELNLDCAPKLRREAAREFTVAVGLGDSQHTALQKTVSALAMPSSSTARASSSNGTGPPIPSGWRPSRAMAAS